MDSENKEKQYTTEKECRRYIASIKWVSGFICPACHYNKAWVTKDVKYKCKKCGYKVSVTLGTIFQNSHIPLLAWFRGIDYISSQTASITVRDFQQVLGVKSIQTAFNILYKIKKILEYPYPYLEKLSGTIELFKATVRINDKPCLVLVGVENINSRIGRIRIQPIRRGMTGDITDFVKNCIEPKSILICREYLFNYSIPFNDYTVLSKEDIRQRNKDFKNNGDIDKQYHFLRIDRIENKLLSHYKGENVQTILDDFCIKENLYKTRIPFDKIVELAVSPHNGKHN